MMIALYLAVVLLISIIATAAGLGGGVIIKPVFDAISPYSTAVVSLLSTFSVLSMSLASSIKQSRLKTPVRWRHAVRIASGSMFGGMVGQSAFSGAKDLLTDAVVKVLQNGILLLLLFAVLFYILCKRDMTIDQTEIDQALAISERIVGFVTGAVSAFIGIGGGPINICALCLLYQLSIRDASVYSLVMIVFSQGAKLLLCLLDGTLRSELWFLIAGACVTSVTGGILGAMLNRRLRSQTVRSIYLIVLFGIIILNGYNIVTNLLLL